MMRKGDISMHALFSLVLVMVILALAIYLIYAWSGQGSDVFWKYINVPVGVGSG